jgi:hypothetical protein
VNYGLMLTRTGRVPEARAQLETVLKPAEAAYNIGSVREQIGRKDQARAAGSSAARAGDARSAKHKSARVAQAEEGGV